MAFIPACNCERVVAASQTSAADVPAPGVTVASGAGVAVEVAEVGLATSVPVGEASAVDGGEVEEGMGVAGGSELLVPVDEGLGELVAAGGGGVREAGPTVDPALSVAEGVVRSDTEV